MISEDEKIKKAWEFIQGFQIKEMEDILRPFMPIPEDGVSEITDDVYKKAYTRNLRIGICLGCSHTLCMIETAVKRHENPEKFLGKAAIKTTIDRAIVKYFTTIQEKEAYMQGIEDSRVMYNTISPDTIDFLEQYLHQQPIS